MCTLRKSCPPREFIKELMMLYAINHFVYGERSVKTAIEDAFSFAAFSCEYIANLLEQRARPVREPGVLHLTRSSDLLDLTIDRPDLSIYDINGDDEHE